MTIIDVCVVNVIWQLFFGHPLRINSVKKHIQQCKLQRTLRKMWAENYRKFVKDARSSRVFGPSLSDVRLICQRRQN